MDLSKLDVHFESSDDDDSSHDEEVSQSPVATENTTSDDLVLSTQSDPQQTEAITLVMEPLSATALACQKHMMKHIDSQLIPLNKILVNSGLLCTRKGPIVSSITDTLTRVNDNLSKIITCLSQINCK
ncbi:hypothetical protein RCL1_004188 [Eukaryota sp. TZLM3-RCL]